MAHWFDRLCLSVAGEQQPSPAAFDRRGFLFGALGSFAGAVGSSAKSWAQPPRRPPINTPTQPPRFPRPLPGQCTRTISGNTATQSVELTQGGLTYRRQLTYDAGTKSVTDTVTLAQGATTIATATTNVKTGGATTTTINYGGPVTGIRAAHLTSPDGKVFTGTVDDRRIVSRAPSRTTPVTTEYLDHRPPAVATAATDLHAPVKALVQQASGRFKACHTITDHPLVHGPMRTMDYKPGGGGANDPGDGWYEPGGSYNSPDCDQCENNCNDTAEKYSGVDDWEVWICPPCLAAALAAYDAIWLACYAACQLPGGGCCPVPCGGAFTCCGKNDHCFRGDLCCPSNMVVCNNVCCGPNIGSCAGDGTCGCPSGMSSCGESCCSANEDCCGGLCVARGGCNGGCPSPQFPCAGQCCGPFSNCCGGKCCLDRCVNGVCCPMAQACGNVCCPSGQLCNNGTCFGCPGGLGRIRRVACQSLGPNNQQITTCCQPIAPTCCGGVCCGVGQEYCVAHNGTYVCTNVNPNPIN